MSRRLVVFVLLALLPTAAAQEDEPTLNESDMNTTEPAPDDSYLPDSQNASASNGSTTTGDAEPTLSDADLDTSVPTPDDSYLADAGSDGASPGSPTSGPAAETPPTSGARTPGIGGAPLLVALLAVAALARRR